MVRRGRSIAVVGVLLIGCAVLLVVGCSGVRSGASKREKGHSPEATASKEEARCEGTRTTKDNPMGGEGFTARVITNDIPGCPKGGPLLGTDKRDFLNGVDGDDEIRGLGARDELSGGDGNDVIYGGPGGDSFNGGKGNDVIYGGDGNDFIWFHDGQRDKIYCGKGKDHYRADKVDYVDSSCEKKMGRIVA